MRGNELSEAAMTRAPLSEFPIPMRGNELAWLHIDKKIGHRSRSP